VNAPVDQGIELSAGQTRFFAQEGYLVLDQISTPAELERLRAIYDDLFERKVGRSEGNQFDLAGTDEDARAAKLPQILQFSEYAPELRDSLAWRNAGRIMSQLLRKEPDRRRDHAILKPARHGAATPWHQDEAYWNPAEEHRSLSIWFALQDVDAAMGCMHFVPGSHLFDVLPHRPIGGDPRIHGLELDEDAYSVRHFVSCPLRAGGCTVHSQRTLHYAPPNRSDEVRRAWIMMGDMQPKPLHTPRRFPWQEVQHTARARRERTTVHKPDADR
jgi:hypothetical protein